jgi:hypothetical protein
MSRPSYVASTTEKSGEITASLDLKPKWRWRDDNTVSCPVG